MTRRDYVALAAILKANKPEGVHPPNSLAVWSRITQDIAHLLTENPRFDRSKFLKACGDE